MWIYGANRPLGEEEGEALRADLLEFVDRWTAHGTQLLAAIDIMENRFAIVAVDEAAAAASVTESISSAE